MILFSCTKEESISTKPIIEIGKQYQGGIIAYILKEGDSGYIKSLKRGLIAASLDQSTSIRWYNGSYTKTKSIGTSIGTGEYNTIRIMSYQGYNNYNYAAALSDAYRGGGFSKWYLPSKDELNKLFLNRVAIGGFNNNSSYWSSSEIDSVNAWGQNFYTGSQGNYDKSNGLSVRAIKAFSEF